MGCLIFGHLMLVIPGANAPIMSGRVIRSFRDLKHQNPSIISDSIGRARMVQQFRNRGLELRIRGVQLA